MFSGRNFDPLINAGKIEQTTNPINVVDLTVIAISRIVTEPSSLTLISRPIPSRIYIENSLMAKFIFCVAAVLPGANTYLTQ